MGLVLALGFASILGGSCGPRTVISPTLDPLWLTKGTPLPYDAWVVTQGEMEMIIEAINTID